MDSRLKLGMVIGALGVAGGVAWLSTARDARAQTTTTSSVTVTLALEGAGTLDGDYGTISSGYIGGNADGGLISVSGKSSAGNTLNCTIKTKDQSTPVLAFELLSRTGGKITCVGTPTKSTTSKTVYNLDATSYAFRPK